MNEPLTEAAISAAILAGAFVAARLLSLLFTRVLARAARRTQTSLDDRLVAALDKPVTQALFLVGAWFAVHRLPLPAPLLQRADGALFVVGVLLAALALMRAFAIFLGWYTTESRLADDDGPVAEFAPLLGKVGTVFIVALAAITILQRFGVSVSSLVVSLGVGSLALGLAAQDTLGNMFAGFTLMLDRPFRLGDRVQLASGEVGDVEEIGIRSTRIRTIEDTALVVPNSLLVKDRLLNFSHPSRRLLTRVEVGVAYGSDLATVKRVLAEAAAAAERVDHEHVPLVLMARLGDNAAYFQVSFRVRDFLDAGRARAEVLEAVYRGLEAAGVEAPPVPRFAVAPADRRA